RRRGRDAIRRYGVIPLGSPKEEVSPVGRSIRVQLRLRSRDQSACPGAPFAFGMASGDERGSPAGDGPHRSSTRGGPVMGENREQQQAGKASVTSAQEDLEVGQRRIRRHEMHRSQTYAAFIKQLCERGGMSPGVAEKAATSVLCAIEQRIMPD